MTKRSPKVYLFLLAALLLLMSIPFTLSEKIRGFIVSSLTPFWSSLKNEDLLNQPINAEINIQKLQIENRMLNAEVLRLQELLQQEFALNTQTISTLNLIKTSSERQKEAFVDKLSFQFQAVPAQVIFRSPSSWNSSLWLNVGKINNLSSGQEIIAKNSPVVVGNSIIGIVDYIGEEQCRVRLITDSGLTPSVRAVRGDPYKRMVAEHISLLINRFACYHGLFKSQEEKELMVQSLTKLQRRLSRDTEQGSWYLAKGELHGSSKPLWRSKGTLLKGVGFNYDFPDEEGPARDLRTGIAVSGTNKDGISLLQVNDLLVTTGMDGVFPAGLYVAEITKIHLLKEGDYSYELEARPTAGDLQELSTVFVLPPVRTEAME